MGTGNNEFSCRPHRSKSARPLDGGQLAAFEERFAVRLPPEYVALLRRWNGGRPVTRYVNRGGHTLFEVDELYGLWSHDTDDAAVRLSPAAWDHGNLWGETRAFRDRLDPHAVPIGTDGGGNVVYLRTDREPAAVWRLVLATGDRYEVAPSLAAFLRMFSADLID